MWPLPALRTVRAVLPHTALQSFVSSSGVPRLLEGCAKGEQTLGPEERVLASFDAADQRRHHALGPDRGFRPRPSRAAIVCPGLSLSRHCRDCALPHLRPCASNSPPPFPWGGFAARPSPRLTPHHGNMKALTPALPTGLLAYLALPSRHSDPNHAGCPMVAFPVASAPPVASRLHHERAAPACAGVHAKSGSSSYGLPVHLRLLPTPPHGDAVTFDFGACDRPRHGLAPCRQSALTRRTRSRASGNPVLQVFERLPPAHAAGGTGHPFSRGRR